MKVLITGGAGYIGSHTIIELLKQGYEDIVSLDNYSNSDSSTYDRIEAISGNLINYVNIDLLDFESLKRFFKENKIETIIHFAALKSVPESVSNPNLYYQNNLNSLLNLLDCCTIFQVNNFIFSSSCSVYGNPESLPVTENTPFGKAESPYAHTKQIGEEILNSYSKSNPHFKHLSLRYFNPAGADESFLIGEKITERPNNLIPIFTQTAAGIRESFTVFGKDYDTIDGSCIRDYIHVSDIAEAHVRAIEYLNTNSVYKKVINLGTGVGSTVLEMIEAFEYTNNLKLNYVIGNRREGDVESIFANNQLAEEELNWVPKRKLPDIMKSAWEWQKRIASSDDISLLSK